MYFDYDDTTLLASHSQDALLAQSAVKELPLFFNIVSEMFMGNEWSSKADKNTIINFKP